MTSMRTAWKLSLLLSPMLLIACQGGEDRSPAGEGQLRQQALAGAAAAATPEGALTPRSPAVGRRPDSRPVLPATTRPDPRPRAGWDLPAQAAEEKPQGALRTPAIPAAVAAKYAQYEAELARRGISGSSEAAVAAAAEIKARLVPEIAADQAEGGK
jgi:hypothetical protein